MADRFRPSLPGVVGATLHILLLANTVRLILGSAGADWTRHWVWFLALDFPVSLGVMPVTWLVPPAAGGPLADVSNFWWPLLYHGLVGTAWWYIVAGAVVRRFRRTEAEVDPPA